MASPVRNVGQFVDSNGHLTPQALRWLESAVFDACHIRASLASGAVTDATWTAFDATSLAAKNAKVSGGAITVQAGLYSVMFDTAFTGPTAVEAGYTLDGSSFTSLATGIPAFIAVPALLPGRSIQFGFRPTGSGTFDGGTVYLVRES